MKVRLTESQYDKLLKVVNPNKKLIITESQYRRLILEANSQVVFSKIKGGQAFKIKASNKDFEFEVIDSDNGQLLVKNTNDGRYVNVYFFIDFNGINNNQLITKISKAKAGPYSRITPELIKDAETWKVFTFKNVTSFHVFKDKTFSEELLSINTKTGEEINNPDEEGSTDVDYAKEIRDGLIKNVVPNKSYQITFYDDSILKFFVLEKKGSVIDIKFKTKSEKVAMNYDDVSSENEKNRNIWFKEQDKKINQLTLQLKGTKDKNEADKIKASIKKLEQEKKDYDAKNGRYEGFQTISTSDYTDGAASKWVTGIEDSPEYENGKLLKIDLSKLTLQKNNNKIIAMNKKNDDEVVRLNKELSMAETQTEKDKIRQELKNIQSGNIFNLLVTLIYKPKPKSKATNQGMEWVGINPDSKDYSKNFPLYGIKDLSVIDDDKGTSFTGGDANAVNMEPGEKYDLSRQEMDRNEIENFIKKSNADKFILNTPNKMLRFLGARRKGMIPLEALQQELGNPLKNKDPKDKFIAGHLVSFKPELENVKVVNNKTVLNEFKTIVSRYKSSTPKALVKRYTVGDNHVALNIRDGERMYTLFVQKENELDGEVLKEDEYYVELKYSNNDKEKKQSVAKFKIYVSDYHATKLN
jgi:hypothetical protein